MFLRTLILVLGLTLPVSLHSAPQIDQPSIVEIQILNPNSSLNSKIRNIEDIDFTLSAMQRATRAGSNTQDLTLNHFLLLIGTDSRTNRWFLDMTSGHFALDTPPKLLIYKFKQDDFKKIREKLKAEQGS